MKYKLIYLFLLILAFLMIISLLILREPFENMEQPLEQKIQESMTVFSDILCPVYKILVDDLKAQKEGSESEKNTAAHLEIQTMAGGTVFPCPPPADPVQIPADIDLKIQRTVFFFQKKVESMKEQLTKALGTCVDIKIEGFENAATRVCAPPLGQSKSPPPLSNPENCIPPSDITPEQRKTIIEARYNTLATVVNQKDIINALAKVKADSTELLELKRKGEAGELASSCPT